MPLSREQAGAFDPASLPPRERAAEPRDAGLQRLLHRPAWNRARSHPYHGKVTRFSTPETFTFKMLRLRLDPRAGLG
jgi:hypothetical protein